MQKQPFSHKVGAVITLWQVKYCLFNGCIGPLKGISRGKKDWIGYHLSNTPIKSEIK